MTVPSPIGQTEKIFFMIAGEPSGDVLGAEIIRGLVEKTNGSLKIFGIGGPEMEKTNFFHSLFPFHELACMGIGEIIFKIPYFLRLIQKTVQYILDLQPDALITVDCPEFSLRVAKQVRKKNKNRKIFLIHCVAPSVWAWRPHRAKKIATFLDHLLVLFPFEPAYFEKEGLRCTFIGHPVCFQPKGSATALCDKFFTLKNNPIICLLPGSRKGEINRLLPIFLDTVDAVRSQVSSLKVIIPTVPNTFETVKKIVIDKYSEENFYFPLILSEKKDIFNAFAGADIALAASGTVTLELAVHEVPTVVAYRVSFFASFIMKKLIRIPYVSLPNIVLNQYLIPECLQEQCSPAVLSRCLLDILKNPSVKEKQKKGFQKIKQEILCVQPFSQIAATAIFRVMDECV